MINYLYALLLVLGGILLARIFSVQTIKIVERKYTVRNSVILKRVIFYSILVFFIIAALNILGVELGVLLGAAGIFTVALGFASQTSMSNLISGMFLIGENAFSVGDVIKIGETVGEVISIDWLSVKLRTPDNMYVRIPNEMLIRMEMLNLNRFQIRRYDLNFSVTTLVDLARLKSSLLQFAEQHHQCLIDPEPVVIFEGFTSSGINLRFSVWSKTEDFISFRSDFTEKTKKLLDEIEVQIAFPHVSVVNPAAAAIEEPEQSNKKTPR